MSDASDGRPWLKFGLAFGLGFVIAGLVFFGFFWRDGDEAAVEPFRARIPPAEFLYLDGPRILSYLAQLEGGRSSAVHRISKEISSISAGGGAGGIQIGASSQREDAAESTVTRTVASGLQLLLNDLRENTSEGVEMHSVHLLRPQQLGEVKEGWLVRFVTEDLLSPGYIRPYVVVRQSATLSALFPRGGTENAEIRSEEQKLKAESFAKQVGPNPRMIFAVVPSSADDGPSLKLLLPMRYRFLTDERSLLEKGQDQYTGGRLIVIGKVIRVFDPAEDDVGDCVAARCRTEGPEYTDWATREIWRNPLEQAANYLIRRVSHNCTLRRTKAELEMDPDRSNPAKGRACFLAKLRRQTELQAPGAVILPLAVYK